MRMINKNEFLKSSVETLGEIFDMLAKLPAIQLKDLQGEQASLMNYLTLNIPGKGRL